MARHSFSRGITIPEILVSSFIVMIMASALFTVVSQLKTQAHSTEAVTTARYDIQFLFRTLNQAFDKTTAEGVRVSADRRAISLQRLNGVAPNGTRSWSSLVTFYFFDPDSRRVLRGEAEVSEVGHTYQPALPAPIDESDLEQMLALRRADGKLKPVSNQIEAFEVDQPNPLTARVRITAIMRGGKYKDEKVEDERTFFFASAAEL